MGGHLRGGIYMKKELKGFIIGVLVTLMLMSSLTFADGVKHTIEVMFNVC